MRLRHLPAPFLLILLACAGAGDDKEGDPDADADVDGYPASEDCDDGDPGIHPGAQERCDDADVDEDCDGRADSADDDAAGSLTVSVDGDGDGYGAIGTETQACETGGDLVARGGDCNDADPAVNPGAAEVCDAADLDEDCDEAADDEDDDVDPAGFVDVYLDGDGDGWGDETQPGRACDPDGGWADRAGDCDDADGAIHPEADEHCDGEDEDCDGTADDAAVDADVWYADDDDDGFGDPTASLAACDAPRGYVADDQDCDDRRADVHPGAAEQCDDVDEDCDGTVDENATDPDTWYGDHDGDGYGRSTDTTEACDAPTGYVATRTDCDDDDAAINPGADEVCDPDDVDEDCDGRADTADASALISSMSEWHDDADGDGYGDEDATYLACDAVGGIIADGSDCDDDDAGVNPGEQEVCDAGDVDEDCDGRADDADGSVDPSGFREVWVDDDADGYGAGAPVSGGCDPDPGYADNGDDCDDTRDDVSPAGTEVCDADDTDEDCDGLADDADSAASGGSRRYPDEDGDGYGDPDRMDTLCDPGAIWISTARDCDDTRDDVNPSAAEVCWDTVDHDCDGVVPCGLDDREADARWIGGASDQLGYTLGSVGDVDGDGREDVGIGQDSSRNELLVVSTGATGDTSLGTDLGRVQGPSNGVMRATLLGDVDGDGLDDIAVAHWGSSYRVGVFVGPHDLDRDFGDAWIDLASGSSLDYYGRSMAAGDADGDGVPDLWVGAPYGGSGSAGVVYVSSGLSGATTFADAITVTGSGGEYLGYGVDVVDLDGDGVDDLVAGAPRASSGRASYAGAVRVFLGPLTADRTSGDADAVVSGDARDDAIGYTVSAGDLDGDGTPDVAIDTAYMGSVGGVGVMFGPLSGSTTTASLDVSITSTYSSSAGPKPVDAHRDLDGDGVADLAFGDIYASPGGTQSGGAYVFMGVSAGSWTYADASEIVAGRANSDWLGNALVTLADGGAGSVLVVGAQGDDDGGSTSGVVSLYVP